MSLSNYLENKLLTHVFGGTSYVPPASVYVGLFTSSPTDGNIGNEVSGSGYSRQSVSMTVAGTTPTQASSSSDIEFAQAASDWGLVTHIGLLDDSTSGNLLAWSEITDPDDDQAALPKNILNGDVLIILAGNLKVRLD